MQPTFPQEPLQSTGEKPQMDTLVDKVGNLYNTLRYGKERNDLRSIVSEVLTRMDYQRIVDYYAEENSLDPYDNIGNTIEQLLELRSIEYEIETGRINTFGRRELRNRITTIKEDKDNSGYLSEWERKAFLKTDSPLNPENEDQSTETAREQRLSTLAFGRNFLETSRKVFELKEIYDLSRQYVPDYIIETFLRYLDIETRESIGRLKTQDIKLYDFDSRFITAIRRYIRRRISEEKLKGDYPQEESEQAEMFTSKRRKLNLESFLNQLRIVSPIPSGPDEVKLLEDDRLKEELVFIPLLFLNSLDVISFEDKPSYINEDDPNFETLGSYTPKQTAINGDTIPAKIYVFKRALFNIPSSKSTEEMLIKATEHQQTLLLTVFHEFGHHSHRTLTFNEMLEWEGITQTEKVDVTKYVFVSRQKNYQTGQREDFSETFSYFIKKPAILEIISPKRFEFMKKIFLSRLSEEESITWLEELEKRLQLHKTYWAEKGLTEEDVRQAFL